MTTINAELYDALITAKVPEKKARAAAATDEGKMRLAGKADLFVRIFFFTTLLMAGAIGGLAFITLDLARDVSRLEEKVDNLGTKVTSLETKVTDIDIKLNDLSQDVAEIKALLLQGR